MNCFSPHTQSLLAITGICLAFGALSLYAQPGSESFPATHLADLRGFNEPEKVADSARGIAIIRVNVQNKMLRYRLSVTGLTGITAAHFHRGAPGENGPVVQPITGLTDSTRTVGGTWSMSEGAVDSLLAGLIYINVHTGTHPAGHIRSQIVPMPNAFALGMSGDQEEHTVTDTNGRGEALISINQQAMVATYLVRWDRLTGPPTGAHFHLGSIGISGPIIHPIELASAGNQAAMGTWNLNDTLLAHLKAGNVYVNVHTAANPKGEIRGQVLVSPVFTAAIEPENEVPSRADSSNGAGTGFALLLPTPFGIAVGGQAIVENTTGPVQMAHIHIGPVKVNGPVFRGLVRDTSGYVWTMPEGFVSFTSADTAAIFLASGTYMNFHTARFPGGEVRGQLIPAATNLSVNPSSVSVTMSQVHSSGLVSRIDREAELIHFAVEHKSGGGQREIVLYSSTGDMAGRVAVKGESAMLGTTDLASGFYLAQLLVDGRPMGSSSVVIVR